MRDNRWMEVWVSLGLIVAIGILMFALFGRPARGDGLQPAPGGSRSCLMVAAQMGYLTGRPEIAHANTEWCILFTRERAWVLPYEGLRYPPPPPMNGNGR